LKNELNKFIAEQGWRIRASSADRNYCYRRSNLYIDYYSSEKTTYL